MWAAPPSDASRGTDTFDPFDWDQYDASRNPKSVTRNETTRAILTPTLGGSTTRVRLSNRFGTVPVTFAHATIALRASEAALVPGTTAPLTFDGDSERHRCARPGCRQRPRRVLVRSVSAAGGERLRDGRRRQAHRHFTARQTSYLTPEDAGDHTEDVDGGAFIQRTTARPFVSGIEVLAPLSTGAVVALGDSLTDGYQEPASGPPESREGIDADGRWPDVLARRLRAAGRPLSVLNAGLSGNRLLQDGTAGGNPDLYGPAAIRRLDADVFSQAGVTTVILFEGNNDLLMTPNATVEELIDGYRQLIDVMHSRGLRVLLATNTPVAASPVSLQTSRPSARRSTPGSASRAPRTQWSTSTRQCATRPTRRALPHTSTAQTTCTSTSPGTWRWATPSHSSCSSIPRAREAPRLQAVSAVCRPSP